jgi:sulfur carrier protein
VISLTINGKQLELDGPTSLLDYLARLGVEPRAVAVELNGEILERSGYESAVLTAGDVVEIVRMVGGGLRD